ncbi:uncharacterized protein LOC106135263 [Amyelois transitella]|uniref:uncharacterized protein LOC106135263 n=1 Tax=Amyelois transitella TaxID=680683 RepID=UPI00067A91CF|nr:uncharacterized protein LOC106135263 [Amyelois transitella]
MSTRSGKRIHGSFHQTEVEADAEIIEKSVNKTRSKRIKDTIEVLETTVSKPKKRKNYVSYPSEEEASGVAEAPNDEKDEYVRGMTKNTLKEQNFNVSNVVVDNQKPVRLTRRTKKFIEDDSEKVPDVVALVEKKRKNKKNKSKRDMTNENVPVVSKKSKKKKKKCKQQSPGTVVNSTLNKSDMSVDSFHSAAGSPVNDANVKNIMNATFEKTPEKQQDIEVVPPVRTSGRKRQSTNVDNDVTSNVNKSLTLTAKKEVSRQNSTFEITEIKSASENKSTTPNKSKGLSQNSTFEITEVKSTSATEPTPNKSRNSQQNSTFEITEVETITSNKFEKGKHRKSSIKNGTFDGDSSISMNNSNNKKCETPSKLNSTFEKAQRKSPRLSSVQTNIPMNNTYDKDEQQTEVLNATFDKLTDLNSTFDKDPEKTSSKSSLVTSDDTGNLTFDKSDERISITSDDSRIENTTPVLIESSMDESLHTSNSSKQSPKVTIPTPLKREGTFTKDGPEIVLKTSIDSNSRTPTKRVSLATPGSTPFPFSKSGQKEKAMLNVTRSIEKSRLSISLDAPAPRLTRVMFCSPVNNPVVVAQQKRKVIKSNLKGSNKSFVFEETASPARAAPRKRSYTHSDAEDARAKRCRLDHQLQAATRLSKPRGSTTKPNEPPTTPSKRVPTPSKSKSESKVSRTRLPNFAALHQRRFDKMESLEECQERKARRAKQLLTPSAAITVLERNSPRGSEPVKPKEPSKKPEPKIERRPESKPVAKLNKTKDLQNGLNKDEKIKPVDSSKDQKADVGKTLTLDSLKRGYTRFGFKMDIGVNPFSVPKTETKVRETRNGLTRQMTQPSLAGATVARKEAAKQLVMREKSFTHERRDLKRKESRTVIKGVRTNRRFELQMQMRNIS